MKEQLIQSLCDNLDIPGIGDTIERKLVEKTIGAVFEHVPPFIWKVVIDGSDGFSKQEVDELIGSVSNTLAKYAKIGWLPESIRAEVIRQVLSTIREAMQVDAFLTLSPMPAAANRGTVS
jgi:hypothetical protein